VNPGISTRNDEEPIKVDDAAMATLHLTPDEFHGDWNYAIAPATPGRVSKQRRRMPGKLTK
jgi:hypothetical protein